MILALDTETTGLDFNHGVKPFLVTTCADDGTQNCFLWDVDPKTRQPYIPPGDIEFIKRLVESADQLCLHNTKFDLHALQTIIPDLRWDWDKVDDTLIAAHVLRSDRQKDLTSLCVAYLDEDIEPYEKKLDETVKECVKSAKKYFPQWKLAKIKHEDMPSIKRTAFKADMWLPRALAKQKGYPEAHPYYTVVSDYANKDSEVTLRLWFAMSELLREMDLWAIYKFRLQSIRLAHGMEKRGITMLGEQTQYLVNTYTKTANSLAAQCVTLAAREGYELELPKSGINQSLRSFMLDVLKLPPQYNKKSDGPTLDKQAREFYRNTLPSGCKQLDFVQTLDKLTNAKGSLGYLEQYQRFWIANPNVQNLYTLYPNFNPTASATLRWGSDNPNAQNIKKNPDSEGFSLRSCFGPGPGREWWSLDAKNIELRIPFYESGEPEMIDLFERENEPPFYGSNHMLVFSILWPDLWNKAIKDHGIEKAAEFCKSPEGYKATQYQWTKNFDFAVQYGSGEKNADLTAHLPGAYRMVNQKFAKLATLNQKYIDIATRQGYVETLPDRSVDPTKGYPLWCTQTDYGILTTTPLNYHVSGSAMWMTQKCMIRVEDQLAEWRRHDNFDGFIVIQIHDELVLDFPKRAHPRENPRQSNLARARIIQDLMSSCGDDFVPSLPTPVNLEFHDVSWAKGLAL